MSVKGASNVQGEMRTLQNKYTQLKKGLSEMKATSSDMGSKRKISTLFAEIPSAMSDGMWLTSLSLSKDRTTQGYIVEVVGRIYLGDEYQEMKSLDMFINRLKSLSTAYALKDIKIVYTERKTESKDNEFMSFQIRGTGD